MRITGCARLVLRCTEISLQSAVVGQQPPRHRWSRAAATPPITDMKADSWRGCRDAAFLIAVNIAKLQSMATADIEGHSEAAELGQPG